MSNNSSDPMIARGRQFLDGIYESFPQRPEDVSARMRALLDGLCTLRRSMPQDNWQQFCKDVVPNHGICDLIHQDPFTFHSVEKPRGYAGDAVLLDYIYGHNPVETTDLGKSICEFTVNTPASAAVRERAGIIAKIIDRVARQRGPIRVLSIACGHLREADMTESLQSGDIKEYVVFDQDEDSIEEVNRRFSDRNVHTIRGSIGELLMGKHKTLNGFDFVYAAGLYDYLSQRLATRLTSWMFNATCPGGVALLTNFLPDIVGSGYMEAFMEWNLIFRTVEELEDTTRKIPSDQIVQKRSYVEDNERVAFVELEKAVEIQPTRGADYQPVRPRQREASEVDAVQ